MPLEGVDHALVPFGFGGSFSVLGVGSEQAEVRALTSFVDAEAAGRSPDMSMMLAPLIAATSAQTSQTGTTPGPSPDKT